MSQVTHDVDTWARADEALARRAAPADMLAAWEHGQAQSPVERGLTLLSLVCPGLPVDQLAALSIGERDRRLLALRQATFGTRLAGLVTCIECGERLELDVPVGDLRVASPDNLDDILAWCGDGIAIRLRLPDSNDLRAIAARDTDGLPADDDDTAAHALMRRCIVSARRGTLEVDTGQLPVAVLEHAAGRLATADPQADLQLALTCAACGTHWKASFDIVSFLWTELDTWATQMLWEIHTLASAYGWSERDILALGPSRRAAYLGMVLG